ncbi:hypothetical protein Tco_1095211, partial [Tanacetum coccineum]
VSDETVHKELGDRMERAATTTSSLEAKHGSGAKTPYWGMWMLKLGLRLHLNNLMIHLSQEVTHLEVGRTVMAKANTVNGERQMQALIDKKKIIITESSIRSDLHLEDAGVTQEEPQQDDSVPTPSNDPLLNEEGLEFGKEEEIKNYRVKKAKESCIEDIDKDADVSLVDDTQGRSDDAEMVDDEVVMNMPVGGKQKQSAKERKVNTRVEVSVAPTTIEAITLAQTLIQIKVAKPKVFTTAATTTTTTRPKARGVVVQEPSEFRTLQASQPSMTKDKGKAIMIEPEEPLKRKYQVALDKDLVRNLQAQLEAELIKEERLARK